MYKIIGPNGWTGEERYSSFEEAFRQLKRIRRAGRQAIIVDSAAGGISKKAQFPDGDRRNFYAARVDLAKNRLYLTLGHLTDRVEIEKGIRKISKLCRQLDPGFTCITDLRFYSPMQQRHEKYVRETQKLLIDTGVGKVVRVGGKEAHLGLFQAEQLSVVYAGYSAPTVESIEEAEKILDEFDAEADS